MADMRLVYMASEHVKETYILLHECLDSEVAKETVPLEMFEVLHSISNDDLLLAVNIFLDEVKVTHYPSEYAIAREIVNTVFYAMTLKDFKRANATRMHTYLSGDYSEEYYYRHKARTILRNEEVLVLGTGINFPEMCSVPTTSYSIMLVHLQDETQLHIPKHQAYKPVTLHDVPVTYLSVPESMTFLMIKLYKELEYAYEPEYEFVGGRVRDMNTKEVLHVHEVYLEAKKKFRELPSDVRYAAIIYREWCCYESS